MQMVLPTIDPVLLVVADMKQWNSGGKGTFSYRYCTPSVTLQLSRGSYEEDEKG